MITLARHPPIDPSWTPRCYGDSDVPLADDTDVVSLATRLASLRPTIVWHSGLRRTQLVAEKLAAQTSAALIVDERLRERDFGQWEGRSWNNIYAETGSAMDGMIDAPDTWRPPGGETTFELRDRAVAWLPSIDLSERHVAITHGGVIASLAGTLSQTPVRDWPQLTPRYGETTEITTAHVDRLNDFATARLRY